jgi:hypothetical protein
MPTKKCVHPLAAIIPLNVQHPAGAPIPLICKLCRRPVHLPPALRSIEPPKDLVQACTGFLKYVSDHSESGAQVNPRIELALILAMNDALHELRERQSREQQT